MVYMLEAHPIFRDLAANPVVNTLHRLILGDDFRLATSNGFIKWAHPEGNWGKYYGLHCDSPLVEPADARFAANCNWFLTDCEADDGPLCYLPGTHRTGKHPMGNVTPELLAQVRPVHLRKCRAFQYSRGLSSLRANVGQRWRTLWPPTR